MKNKTTKPNAQIEIELTVFWGNDDAESIITLSHVEWKRIKEGAKDEISASSWYEGEEYDVVWRFSNAKLTVYGDGGAEHVCELPVEELIVRPKISI
jgi:hypothetical protein